MRKFLAALTMVVLLALPSFANKFPNRLITNQFSGNAFTLTDPNTGSLGLSSATGNDFGHGLVTVVVTTGFTAPVTLSAFYWSNRINKWIRVGPSAAGTNSNEGYQQAMDSNYTSWIFPVPPNQPFIITSSAAITGAVYTDSVANPNNNNTAAL